MTPVYPSSTSMMVSSMGSSRWPVSSIGLEHDLGTRNGQLEAFAPHVLDQDRKLKFAAARHDEAVGFVAVRHLDRDVAFRFAHQAVADHAALNFAAFLAGKRTVVDAERHRQRRRIDRLGVQRLYPRTDRTACRRRSHPSCRQGDDFAGARFIDRHTVQAADRREPWSRGTSRPACRRGGWPSAPCWT